MQEQNKNVHVLKHLDAVVERVEVGDVHMCAERNALCVLLLCRLRRVRAFLWRTSALFLLLLFLPFLCRGCLNLLLRHNPRLPLLTTVGSRGVCVVRAS